MLDNFEDGGILSNPESSVIYRKNSDNLSGFGTAKKTQRDIAIAREARARIERGLEARERMTSEQLEEEARLIAAQIKEWEENNAEE